MLICCIDVVGSIIIVARGVNIMITIVCMLSIVMYGVCKVIINVVIFIITIIIIIVVGGIVWWGHKMWEAWSDGVENTVSSKEICLTWWL